MLVLLFIFSRVFPAHAVLDVVVDNEIQLLLGDPVVLCQDPIDLVDDGLGFRGTELLGSYAGAGAWNAAGQPPCVSITSSISAINRIVSCRATTIFW